MTAEDRYVVELSDIHTVRLECSACGAALSFRLADWKKVPHQCPGCSAEWHHGLENEPPIASVFQLARSMRQALAVSANLPFRMRFELDRPKN